MSMTQHDQTTDNEIELPLPIQIEAPADDDLSLLEEQLSQLKESLSPEEFQEAVDDLHQSREYLEKMKEEQIMKEEETKFNHINVKDAQSNRTYCHDWPNTKSKAEIAEEKILRSALSEYLKEHNLSYEQVVHKVMVKIQWGKNFFGKPNTEKMNTLVLGKWPNPDKQCHQGINIVCCHGYGAGAAFWFLNTPFFLELIAGRYSTTVTVQNVFLVDWLGFGLSSRPPFPSDCVLNKAVDLAENFFVSSLESWRTQLGLERFLLVGHSLGGYLSTVYSLTHPERVTRLVLLSPAGVATKPDGPLNEREKSLLFKIVKAAINMNLTPYSLVRGIGPSGPAIMRAYVRRGYQLPETQASALASYLYQINSRKGSGEFALKSILLPGAFAVFGRRGLMDRIGQLTIPVSFYYGDYDWMNPEDAVRASRVLKAPTRVVFIENAGHNLFVHNPDQFAREFIRELQ